MMMSGCFVNSAVIAPNVVRSLLGQNYRRNLTNTRLNRHSLLRARKRELFDASVKCLLLLLMRLLQQLQNMNFSSFRRFIVRLLQVIAFLHPPKSSPLNYFSSLCNFLIAHAVILGHLCPKMAKTAASPLCFPVEIRFQCVVPFISNCSAVFTTGNIKFNTYLEVRYESQEENYHPFKA